MLCFFNETATTEIYTLSLHDALPIFGEQRQLAGRGAHLGLGVALERAHDVHLLGPAAVEVREDRKSTRLNSSHANISYAVFCLKKHLTDYPRESFTLSSLLNQLQSDD